MQVVVTPLIYADYVTVSGGKPVRIFKIKALVFYDNLFLLPQHCMHTFTKVNCLGQN